jgi:tetratricopeptide (TPR) repeat protein/GT2 family glycosyltransferase/glycosyltransferase involved in cell wall biosynthesis
MLNLPKKNLSEQNEQIEESSNEQSASFTLADSKQALSEIERGDILWAKDRLTEAIECYRQAIELDPSSATAHHKMALALKQQGNLEQASSYYRQAISLSTTNAKNFDRQQQLSSRINSEITESFVELSSANFDSNLETAQLYIQQALAYSEGKNWEQAISACEEALQIFPNMAEAHKIYGNSLHKLGKVPQALSAYAKALSIQPDLVDIYVNVGSVYAGQQEWQQAISYYQKAIEIDPNLGIAYRNLGKIWNKLGDRDKAQECFDRAENLDSNSKLNTKKELPQILSFQPQAVLPLISEETTPTQLKPDSPESYAKLGDFYAEKQQWEEAIFFYQKAIKLEPKFIQVYRNLARIYNQFGQSEKATECLFQALTLEPNKAGAEQHFSLGNVLRQQRKNDRAIDCYRQAIKLQPEFSEAYLRLGEVLSDSSEIAKAIACYQEALKLNPSSFQAHHNLGDAFAKKEKWEEATAAYLNGIKLNPEFSWSYNNLGNALLKQQQWEEAAQCYQQAIQLNPHFAWSYYNFAEALVKLERWKEAESAYRRSHKLQSDLPNLESKINAVLKYKVKAEHHQALDFYLKAIERDPEDLDSYNKAIAIEPDDAILCLKLANALVLKGQAKKAMALCQRAIGLNPQLPQGYEALGQLLREQKKWQELTKLYQKAIELHPNHSEFYFRLGEVFACQRQWEEAKAYYQKTISLDPNYWQVRHDYGDVLLHLADWEGAIGHYRKALELNPDHAWSHHNLGTALFYIELWEESAFEYNRAIELDSFLVSCYDRLGEILFKQKKWSEAIELYHQVREYRSDLLGVFPKLRQLVSAIEQQLESDSDPGFSYYLLGEAYTQLSHWEGAIASYIRSQELNFYRGDLQQKLDYAREKQQQQQELDSIGHYQNGELHRDSSFIARITEVALGGIIKGWAIDNTHPSRSLKIEVRIDNYSVAVVETKKICPDIAYEELAGSPQQFEVHLPALAGDKVILDDEEHLIELISLTDKGDILSTISVQLVLPRRGIGRIDSCENNRIKGWIIPDNHTGTASVDLYIDELFYSSIAADLPRQDLTKYGLGNGHNGFEIRLPFVLGNNKTYKVNITYSGTQQHLQKSPISLNFAAKEFEKQQNRRSWQFSGLARGIGSEFNVRGITIVIPIFNAYEELRNCLQSVIEHTSIDARLLLIDDASTDERMSSLLEWAATYSNIDVVRNEQNLGYTKTINRGIELAGDDDIVLLNSDTMVGPRWLQNLKVAAYHDVDIATVTAMSDNAGAFSVPNMGSANQLPNWLNFAEVARSIAHHSATLYPEVPTGNGFCLYIRRAVFKDIGMFDEAAFPRGYGEENDFCMRALRAGWRHIIDDRTLVRHVRSASFKGEKAALYESGRKVVDERYPEYKMLTKVFTKSPDLQAARYIVRKSFETNHASQKPVLPRILYVISTQTGGTPQTNEDLMKGVSDRYHPFLLQCNSREIALYDTSCQPYSVCERVELDSPITVQTHRSAEYDSIVSSLLIRYNIELLHIRHIAWHSVSLPKLAKKLGIPVIFSIHDFYTICPTVNLLDENKVFCGGSCTSTEGKCDVELWQNNLPALKHNFINSWREIMTDVFEYIDAFVTTAKSAKTQIEEIYPSISQIPFWVIPHGRDFPHLESGNTSTEQFLHPSKPLKILFPGNLGIPKGAELIAKIKELDLDGRLEFHFLGAVRQFLVPFGKRHGTYKREEYHQLIQKIQPHYIGIFSIWSETYCHTLTESWASGVPAIAIDRGAVGDRIRQHGGGYLLNTIEPEEIYQQLLEISQDLEGYSQRNAEVRCWQRSYSRQNSTVTMAAKYLELYQQVLDNSHSFKLEIPKQRNLKLGVLIKRPSPDRAYPSGYIRVLEWLKHPDIASRLNTQFLNIDAFLQDEHRVLELDVILIQRNAIEPHLVRSLIETCRQRNLPYVFELDDDLMNVPAEKDTDGSYARNASSLQTLATEAAAITVSTEPLAEKLRHFNGNLTVIPNVISEFPWFSPLDKSVRVPDSILKAPAHLFKVLYMGNPTHGEDLAIIRPVFARLKEEGHPVRLFVIGGEPETYESNATWYQRLEVPDEIKDYPNFVSWFRTIASHCDLGIAPLVDTEFNRCKSNLKFLQYSAVGLPSLYSDVVPYSNSIERDVNGILVENTIEAWYDAIVRCLQERDYLNQIGQTARQTILDRHLMSHYIEQYCTIFENLIIRK